jgi:hypothetical protein
MLRITIELVPFGREAYKRTIAGINIINDGTGDVDIGNYKYELMDDHGDSIKGKLKGHNRQQSVFKILQAVLNKALF